jgi:hypothetical protein
MPTLAGLCAAALALFAVAQPPAPALATSAASSASAIRPAAAPASTAPAWTGSFSGINDTSWHSTWGVTSDSAQCAGASGTFSCNWGYSNMQAVNDSTAPGGGPALEVTYPAKSGPPSCHLTVSGCGLAAGSTHTYTVTAVDGSGVESAHRASASAATSGGGGGLSVTLAKTKDWGSGYTDTATLTDTSGSAVNGWNVQFDLDATENIESSAGVSYACGASHCTLTNLSSDATVAPGASLTFHFSGDYPSSGNYIAPANVTAYALDGGGQSPATPTGLTVTGTTATSVSLSWTETNNSDPAASYRVYEGGSVVASPSANTATISGLAAGTSYSFTVAAVDASAVQSPQSVSVTATTPGGTGSATFSQTDIDSAVGSPLIAFAAPTSSVPRPGTNPTNIGASAVLQYLALVDKEQPGATASNGATVDSALLAQVRNLIAGSNEPDADGGLEGWSHALVAEALLLVKNGPAWSELTAIEQNKVTLLEAAMGYAGNYTYNDANNFSSGICGFGNFSKTNNPNYRDGYVDVEIAAIQYFGASTWTSMLQNFNDANEVSALSAAGLSNAAGCYKTVGSAANSAIGRPFVYQGIAATDLMGLWNVLASDTFDLTVTSSVSGTASGSSVTAHIADNTTSPEQGKTGMGKEFDSTDSQGLRSSALYVFEGWMNVTGSRLAMTALGNYSCSAASAAAPYQVGSLDLIYKLHHGYVSYALNQSGILVDDNGSPSTDGPNVKGYQYDLDSYSNVVAGQGC